MSRRERLNNVVIPLLIALLVIAITVAIFFYREEVADLKGYGYLGAFLASMLTTATIILPVPGVIVVLALGAVLPPVLVGLAAGTGAAIGEMTGYMAGFSGRGLVENKKTYNTLVKWLNKWGVLTVFVFALTPLPFDPLGITAGILRFSLWKFILTCWFGKIIANIIVSYAGFYGWHILLPYFS
jgi:uncharacterized membrane protein YdjX (TVP38/TMEM64 family)